MWTSLQSIYNLNQWWWRSGGSFTEVNVGNIKRSSFCSNANNDLELKKWLVAFYLDPDREGPEYVTEVPEKSEIRDQDIWRGYILVSELPNSPIEADVRCSSLWESGNLQHQRWGGFIWEKRNFISLSGWVYYKCSQEDSQEMDGWTLEKWKIDKTKAKSRHLDNGKKLPIFILP